MDNIVRWSGTFKKLYKRKDKKSSKPIMDKVNSALKDLKENPNPETLGHFLNGELKGLKAIELGNKNRLSYQVVRDNNQVSVLLHKVCTHDQVYGK